VTSRLEVAEAMYQAGKVGPGPKMPDSLDELNVETQNRYLLLAEAAMAVTGRPTGAAEVERPAGLPGNPRDLIELLAEELAFKLNNPMQFSDRVREVLGRYAEHVGEGHVSDEVRKAMTI
jgi:hypothetical protein